MTIAPCTAPTFYFIGVSTQQSSIMRVFPRWSAILGLGAHIVGYDAPLHASDEVYRAIVQHIKADPLARGALVTTHKIDLYNAAHDLFDSFDPYARLCGEVSCIAKRGERLAGFAKDPISSGLAWQALVEPRHWGRTGAHVLCLGSGGAAVAASLYAAGLPEAVDRPARFVLVDVDEERLNQARALHAQLTTDIQFEYVLNADPTYNNQIMASLPRGSLVINASGLGKDRPGSPITDDGTFPENGLVWDFNYRGELTFLHQAQRQASARQLKVEDGWVYFLHGWTQVIAEVFQVHLTPNIFACLDSAASEIR